jgi:hypothetical protein
MSRSCGCDVLNVVFRWPIVVELVLEGPTDLEDSSIEDESGVGLSLFLVNLQGMMVTGNVPRRIKNHDPKVKFRLAADHPE